MSRFFIFAFLLVAIINVAEVHAQEATIAIEKPAKKQNVFMDLEYRKNLYEARKLSKGKAIGYSLLLPGLGNFYAEQYFTGVIAMSALVFAGIFAGYGYTTDQPEYYLGAGLTAGLSYVISPIAAYYGVKQYNHNLVRALKITAFSTPSGMGVGFTFDF